MVLEGGAISCERGTPVARRPYRGGQLGGREAGRVGLVLPLLSRLEPSDRNVYEP